MQAALYDDLFCAVQSSLTACAYQRAGKAGSDEEMDDEVDFWLDPETVVFETSPLEEEVYAATYESIKDGSENLAKLISPELIRTYLSTRDFSVIFSVDDDNEDDLMIMVAAVDRSTGVALIKSGNLVDTVSLEKAGNIAKANSASEGMSPYEYCYQFVRQKDSTVSEVQQANSQRRLTALLTEIDTHVLSTYLGKEVQVREDL